MITFLDWLRCGNDCGKCSAMWESHTSNESGEEWDCGCMIKGSDFDEFTCRIPRPIRWLLIRQARYHQNHEYDGIIEFHEELEQRNEKCRAAITEMLEGRVICIKCNDGTLHECNTERIVECGAWSVRADMEPEYQPPPTIPQRWKSLLFDTLMVIPNAIKPFICK